MSSLVSKLFSNIKKSMQQCYTIEKHNSEIPAATDLCEWFMK